MGALCHRPRLLGRLVSLPHATRTVWAGAVVAVMAGRRCDRDGGSEECVVDITKSRDCPSSPELKEYCMYY